MESKDYSNHLFRVSSLGHIMPAAEFYEDRFIESKTKHLNHFAKMQEYKKEYDAISNTETLTAKRKLDQINKVEDAYYAQRVITEKFEKDKDKAIISEGCKTHLMDVWIAHEYGRATKDIRNKYVEKGILMEDTGLVTYGIVKGWIPEKCTERKDDGWIMGEIDYLKNDTIYDNKCSLDGY